MNTTPSLPHDAHLDATLRTLDAAQADLTVAQQARADALLASLTADAGASVTPLDAARSRSRGVRVARWLVPVAAASALVAGSFLWPGSPAAPPAHADWTPTPTPVAADTLTRVTDQCRDGMADWSRSTGDDPTLVKAETARVVLAEQRGSTVMVAMVTDTGTEAACLASAETGRVQGMTGSSPGPDSAPEPALAPTEVTGAGAGLHLQGRDGFAHTSGRVGSDVTGVTIRSGDQTIQATVTDGRYAAWWPVRGVSPEHAAGVVAHLDVTLADGTVLTDVETDLTQAMGPLPGPTEVGRVGTGGGVTEQGEVHTVEGLVGARVVGVIVHLDGESHPATLGNGAFRAEWPVDALPTAEPTEPTFTLTLDDGTVLENVSEAA